MQMTKPLTKPSKQRKMIFQAPDHVRHKLLASHFSPELRGTHIVKNLPVRSGDTIRIMRGDHRGFEGKVSRIDRNKYRIYIEGLTREKVDGTTIFVPIHPSKIMITRLNLDDKWRKNILERKKKALKKPKAAKKPKARLEEMPLEIEEVKGIPEEKEAAKEKPPKKKVVKRKKEVAKKMSARARKVKKEPEKPKTREKEEKPKIEKKRTRRKTAKEPEKGEK